MRHLITVKRIVAGLLIQTVWFAPALGREAPGTPPAAVRPTDPMPIPSAFALPDDGPRFDQPAPSQEAAQFLEAVTAYRRGAYEAAQSGFDAFVMLYPESALIPASVAFNAELTVLNEPVNRKRAEAVNQYRTLIRAYPKDSNAVRAEWRIGDLYREMEWFHEAQSAYEQALGRAQDAGDKERAILGLALTFGSLGRWKDAVEAFQTIRKHTVDDRAFMHATRGLASALYAQHREQDAQPLYESLYQRWPQVLRGDPVLLQQYCHVLFETNRMLQARDACTLLVNLYPASIDAGAVMVRVGDSCRRLGQQKCAEVFYMAAHTHYGASAAGVTARLRLARMEQEIAAVAGEDFLYMKVRGLLRGAPPSYLDASGFEEMYRQIGTEHELDQLGSEALFRLAEYYELKKDETKAIQTYHEVTGRAGKVERDPWPKAAGERLTVMLKPRLEAALNAHDDLTALTLFHWHGANPEQHYVGTDILLKLAEIHRRKGFAVQAVRLYQALVRDMKAASMHEAALIGLGQSYLDQRDFPAAQKVLERVRFLYPLSANSTTVSRLLTTALQEQGNRRGALRIMRAWLQAHPKDVERGRVQLSLARALADDGKPEEALAAFNEAAKVGALRGHDDLLLMADLLTQQRSHQRALELYRQVLAAHPDPEAAEWAKVQIVRNLAAQPDGSKVQKRVETFAPQGDLLLSRATSAIQNSMRTAKAEEGDGPS